MKLIKISLVGENLLRIKPLNQRAINMWKHRVELFKKKKNNPLEQDLNELNWHFDEIVHVTEKLRYYLINSIKKA